MKAQNRINYRAIFVSFYCMFLLGGGTTLLAATKESLMAQFGVGLFEIGLLFTIRSAVCGLVPFVCGGLSDRYGRKNMILIGAGLAALYYALMPAAPSFVPVYLLILIYGIAYGFIDPSSMAILFDTLENPAPAVPFIQVFYSLGAIVAPFMAGFLIMHQIPWQVAYYLYFGLTLLLGLCTVVFRFPLPARRLAGKGRTSYYNFRCMPKPLCEGLILFLFVVCNSVINSTVANWSDIYLKSTFGYSNAASIKVLSYVQMGSLLGSLFMSWAARRLEAPQILRLWPIFTVSAYLMSLFMPSGGAYIVCIMCASFTAGCLFGNAVGYAGMLFPMNSGASTGAISSASAAGIAICSFLIGRFVPSLGAGTVFLFMGCFGMLSVLLGQIIYYRHQHLLKQGA